MRTFSNFLLFEDVLTSLPTGSSLIENAASKLMAPTINIVEDDCGTLLGIISDVNYSIEGQVELSNSTIIDVNRINTLLAQGVSTVRIRTSSTCISKGGLCSLCCRAALPSTPKYLNGSWLLDGTSTLNGIDTFISGERITLSSEFIYKTEVIIGDGINSSYPIYQTSLDYTKTNYSMNPANYPFISSITDTAVNFNTVRNPEDVFVLHYYNVSSNPFLEYLAKSYSGGLFGIAPLPSYPLQIKPSLYQVMFSENQIHLFRNELNAYPNIPPTYLEYCDTIQDNLEKVLFIIYTYAIYANIQ